MAGSTEVSDYTSTSDSYIKSFQETLHSIDPNLPNLIDFKLQIQKKNLMILVEEANKRISKYEQIYPYIKELCNNQTINPAWYSSIEKVLNWSLKKGRGKGRNLSNDIKNAWITYIVILSCSMIDKDQSSDSLSRNIFLKTEKGKIVGLKGSS